MKFVRNCGLAVICLLAGLNLSTLSATAEWASGDTAPIKTLQGPDTGLGEPAGLAFDQAGRMYVTNYVPTARIAVYPAGWSGGNAAPVKILEGPSTGLGSLRSIAFDSTGRMYVPVYPQNKILVFAADWASGDTAPIKVLQGASTGLNWPYGVAFDSVGRMYVTNRMGDSVSVYDGSWVNGGGVNVDVAPIKILTGPATLLEAPQLLALDSQGRMFVTNNAFPTPRVTMYPANWIGGDTPPAKTLSGNLTQLSQPHGIAFDSTDRMYVSNSTSSKVTVYASEWASGDTAPLKYLAGSNTGLAGNYALAIDSSDRLFVANVNVDTVTVYGATPAIVVPLFSVDIDPAGGVCRQYGEQSLSGIQRFVGYRYLPSAEDCSRPGHVFVGWANASSPSEVRGLPLLVDPADGVRRYFISENASLLAVWRSRPVLPEAFVGTTRFFCRDCGVTLIWSRPADGSTVQITDPAGSVVCATNTLTDGYWTLCGLRAGTGGSYVLETRIDGIVSEPVTILVE